MTCNDSQWPSNWPQLEAPFLNPRWWANCWEVRGTAWRSTPSCGLRVAPHPLKDASWCPTWYRPPPNIHSLFRVGGGVSDRGTTVEAWTVWWRCPRSLSAPAKHGKLKPEMAMELPAALPNSAKAGTDSPWDRCGRRQSPPWDWQHLLEVASVAAGLPLTSHQLHLELVSTMAALLKASWDLYLLELASTMAGLPVAGASIVS